MRDVVLVVFVLGGVATAIFHPWIGIMGWTVISIMNPHRYAWGASDLPVAAAFALATLVGIVVTRDRIRVVVTPTMVVFALFVVWMCVTLQFSMYVETSTEMWKRVMKIDFMIFVAAAVLYSRQHIMALVWVLVGSLGFYGIKGGIFTIATGGGYRVWGPPESFIEGNNELALAMVMTIPLMRFLQMQQRSTWARYGLAAAMVLTAASALGAQSRGALVAIIAMTIVLWSRTRHKFVSGIVLVVLGASLIAFMPGQWDYRMSTISNYERDESAQGRINAWWMTWNLANDRLFGGGFDIYRRVVFDQYAPEGSRVHAAHSIYFQVLGEHGFVGLALFLLMWFMVWNSAGWLRRNAHRQPESKWAGDLGGMIQACIAGYAVGGAFLSLAYFDLPYNLLLLVVITRRWVETKGWKQEPLVVPAQVQVPGPAPPPESTPARP